MDSHSLPFTTSRPHGETAFLDAAYRLISADDVLYYNLSHQRCCCDETFYQINELIDEQLSSEQASAIRRHIASCSACAQEYSALKATVDLLRNFTSAQGRMGKDQVHASFSCTANTQRRQKSWSMSFFHRLKIFLNRG